MSQSAPKKRISVEVKARLKEQVPKGQRSRFVQKAIEEALRERLAAGSKKPG